MFTAFVLLIVFYFVGRQEDKAFTYNDSSLTGKHPKA
jgi:hypothetical protein